MPQRKGQKRRPPKPPRASKAVNGPQDEGISLKARVSILVGNKYGGSANAAAKAMDIPHATLARIVAGTVRNPRIDVLRRIADHFQIPIGWLTSGEPGRPASIALPQDGAAAYMAAWDELSAVLEALKLSEGAKDALITVSGFTVQTAFARLLERMPAAKPGDPPVREMVPGDAAAIIAAGIRVWTALIRHMVGRWGARRIRAAIDGSVGSLRFGFNGFALDLLSRKLLPADLDRLYGEYRERERDSP